jgi:hypothetical protein
MKKNKSQLEWFKELAREVKADEDEESFKRALKKIREKPKEKKPAED